MCFTIFFYIQLSNVAALADTDREKCNQISMSPDPVSKRYGNILELPVLKTSANGESNLADMMAENANIQLISRIYGVGMTNFNLGHMSIITEEILTYLYYYWRDTLEHIPYSQSKSNIYHQGR